LETVATQSMRAALARGRQRLEIGQVPIPQPSPGEVRVRVRACGVCGSDLQFFRDGFWPPEMVPGHEISGEVDVLGDGVEGVRPGDAVAIEPLVSCGSCPTCRRGLDAICRELQVLGIHRPGGFAQYVNVPARRLFPVPADLDPSLAALSEPMAVMVHAMRRGELAAGQRVLVLGAGTLGLMGTVAARALGAGEVWLTARHPHQAELGARLGATRVLREEQASVRDLDRLGRESPIDLVVETVGEAADTLNSAAAAVRPGGTVSVVGIFMDRTELDALPLLLKETTLAWSNCYAHPSQGADFGTAIDLVSEHRNSLQPLITHSVPLDDVARAFALASDKKAGAVKVTVLP
jgi:threonine dehydrogenase-like Zn-dependent dehydrogenase